MKVIKFILTIILAICGIRAFIEGNILGGLIFLFIAILIVPQVSAIIKSRFKLWESKGVRYTAYIIFILLAGATLPKKTEDLVKKAKIKERKTIRNIAKAPKNKTCNYGGDDFPTIPGLIAADVYINFETIGFEIDKKIKHDHTSILCTLSEKDIRYIVNVDGCSPDELIRVTASVLDYSGSNHKETVDFFGYFATLHYKGAEPEKAKQWVKKNIDNNNAQTEIAGVVFTINFKSQHSKTLTLRSAN